MPCPRSPSPLTDKLNNYDHLMSKELLNNSDKDSVFNSEHVLSIIPDLTHATKDIVIISKIPPILLVPTANCLMKRSLLNWLVN